MENEIPRLSTVWEHSLTNLLGHYHTTEPLMALRHWVHFQGVHSLLDFLRLDPEELKTIQGEYLHLRTNQAKQIYWLITYMKNKY